MRDADERSASHSLSHKNVPPSSSSMLVVARGREDTAGVGLTIKTSRVRSLARARLRTKTLGKLFTPTCLDADSLRHCVESQDRVQIYRRRCWRTSVTRRRSTPAPPDRATGPRAGQGRALGRAGPGLAGPGEGRDGSPRQETTTHERNPIISPHNSRVALTGDAIIRANTASFSSPQLSLAPSLALSSSINYASTTQPTNSRLFIFARACTHVLIIYCLRFSRLHDFRQIAYCYCSAVVAEILSG